MTNHTSHEGEGRRASSLNSYGMMLMMMACCMSVMVLFLLIPVVGWPIGLALVGIGLAVMLYAHQRWMNHGHH